MRKVGELSKGLDVSKGGKNPKSTLPPGGRVKSEALGQAGLTPQTAHRCERVADVPKERRVYANA